MRKLLTTKEAADFLRVTPHTLRRYVRIGILPKIKFSARAVLFRQADLDALISHNLVQASVKK